MNRVFVGDSRILVDAMIGTGLVTGEDREWIVPLPFVSSYELWGLEVRARF